MRTLSLTLAALFLAGTSLAAPRSQLPPCPSNEDKPELSALVRRVEAGLKGRSSVGTMVMSIKTPSWSRTLKLKSWSQGRELALLHVLEGGPRETGMMTLKRDGQLWNYLPKAGRVMKLPSGMMGDAWMGSDFTNDDLVSGSSLSEDFEATLTGAKPQSWQLSLVPKSGAKVVWGRVELELDRKTCLPLEQRFFDEDGKPARRMVFGELREVNGRPFPARMTVIPAEAGRETSIFYEEIELDVDIPEDTFGLQRLRKGR